MVPSALGSTGSNWLVANWSGEGMIAENPLNAQNLVAGGLYQYASSRNNSTAYHASGVSGAFTSWDGGRSWTDQSLPPYPGWFNTSSPTCDQLHLADTAIAFGPNGTVYYIDLSDALGTLTCSVSLASLGLYSTVSTDGGRTWQTPVPIRGTVAGSFVDKPWVAVDQSTGEVYVAYTDDGNGSGIYLQNSTDQGASWSAPVELTTATGTGLGVELVVDPYGGVDAIWMDTSTGAIMFVRSTNHGANFSAPETVATTIAYSSSSPDTFRSYTLPALGVDGFSTNAYTGDLYVTWQNGSGNAAGSPSVSISRSTNNGSRWSAPHRVNSDLQPEDYQPSVAVGADGTVFVDWYAESWTTGHYRFAAALSHDGGLTFDRQFNVSDVDSYPSTTATGSDWWIGDYTDTFADPTGARPLWTDARSPIGWSCNPTGACLWGYVYNISFYTALLVNDSIASTVPATLQINGTVPWAGPTPTGPVPSPIDWRAGDTYNLTAPTNASGEVFAYWYGRQPGGQPLFTNRSTLNGTVAGGEQFVACYTPSAGDTCHNPGAPGFLQVSVTPGNASLTLNGQSLPNASGGLELIKDPGEWWITASAPGYYPANLTFVVTPGNRTLANIELVAITGLLLGQVLPSGAQVELDGSPLVVQPNGTFLASLLPGLYQVDASAIRYAPFTAPSVIIRAGLTTYLNISLAPIPGWINGTVAPASAAVSSNGEPVGVAPDGSFSLRLAPGTYWINATLPGWTPRSSGPVSLGPFESLEVALRMDEYNGTIAGFSNAPDPTVTVDGSPVATTAGNFQVDVVPGDHLVNLSASSYDPLSLTLWVGTNQTVLVRGVLNISGGWVTGTILPVGAAVALDGFFTATSLTGSFNITATAGSHRLTVTAAGFRPVNQTISVAPGRPTAVSIALVAVAPAAGASSDFTGVIGVGAGVIGAALVAAFLLLRRRKSRPPNGAGRALRSGPGPSARTTAGTTNARRP